MSTVYSLDGTTYVNRELIKQYGGFFQSFQRKWWIPVTTDPDHLDDLRRRGVIVGQVIREMAITPNEQRMAKMKGFRP